MALKKTDAEIRTAEFADSELRVESDGKQMIGYSAKFDKPSGLIGGAFVEYVRKGAFSKTIKEADVRALYNHDVNFVLGRNKAGTLTLLEDERGLLAKITPPDIAWANDLKTSISRGDVSQQSFRFRTITDNWGMEKGVMTRELIEVGLLDVGPVTFPAYEDTDISMRSVAHGLAKVATDLDPNYKNIKLFKALMSFSSGERKAEEIELLQAFVLDFGKSLTKIEPSAPAHSNVAEPSTHEVRHSVAVLKKQLDLAEIKVRGIK